MERIEQIKNRDFSIEVSLERLSDTFESLLSDKTLKGSLMELFLIRCLKRGYLQRLLIVTNLRQC